VRPILLSIALLLAGQAPAGAGFPEGVAAFRRGDYMAALREFKPLAEKGVAEAQFNLGVMYRQGLGVNPDFIEARRWYRKAAEQGHPKAQQNLGVFYADGLGVKRDAREAAKWFREAAEQGLPAAQRLLGWAYAGGEGVERDLVLALTWLTLAAARGDAEAGRALPEVMQHMKKSEVAEARRLAERWEPRGGGPLRRP